MTVHAQPDRERVLQEALAALEELERRLEDAQSGRGQPIAVVGLGCRFPGGADGPERYWELLSSGRDGVVPVPPDRWDESFHDPRGGPGKITTRAGGFLERVDGFDADFFQISPREAASLDPQHRLVLEVAWEALEHAGHPPDTLRESRTGVFVGITSPEYLQRQLSYGDPKAIDAYWTSGNALNFAAGRLSYLLGLQGPALAVDTACSSSLVAIHLACQSLRAGESRQALAGGVNLMLSPHTAVSFSSWGMLAPDGRCKTFDAAADGFGRGEGCGIVVLKRLADAQEDGDRILAVIRGSAVNQDGPSSGLLVPNPAAHQAVIRSALDMAGARPSELHYVEAHGTGTKIGDPIELRALGAVMSEDGRTRADPLLVGSVKTNFGHLESAAGVAGLIKVVLSLMHEEIPAHLHLRTPTPEVDWSALPVEVPAQARPWPADGRPRLAGVSAFGASGTNAHLVVEEAPRARIPAPLAATERPRLLPISARSPRALAALAASWRDLLRSRGDAPLDALCLAAAEGRAHHDHRLAVVGSSAEELAAAFDAGARGEVAPRAARGAIQPGRRRKVAFVFPGQGSQWLGMGRRLLAEQPVFREALEACDAAVRAETGWSVLAELAAPEETSRLREIDVVQPVLFSLEVALAALWRSLGVKPAVLVGHSMGEVAAAHVAGCLGLADAARIICRRSRLLRRVAGQGAMAMVELSIDEARAALRGREDRLSVAVSNSPRSTVVAGDPEALQALAAELEQKGVFCRFVKVDVASHSPQMDPLRAELAAALADVRPQAGKVPMLSTVLASKIDGAELDAGYWVRNLREPVLFAAAVEQAAALGCEVFIEMSPHPILLPAVEQGLREKGLPVTVVPSMRREECERTVLLESAAALWADGLRLDWRRLSADPSATATGLPDLPRYPWQRERYWLDERRGAAASDAERRRPGAAGHPLLGAALRWSGDPRARCWEAEFTPETAAYLSEHRVQGLPVLPGAAYVDMALGAARLAFGEAPHRLARVRFEQMLLLPQEGRRLVQVTLREESAAEASFQVASLEEGGDAPSWVVHARGAIHLGGEATSAAGPQDLSALRARLGERQEGPAYYEALRTHGLEYGPAFQGLRELWRCDGEALGVLAPTAEVEQGGAASRIHPAWLDAALQVVGAAVPREARGPGEGETYLPVEIGGFALHGDPQKARYSHVQVRSAGRPGVHRADVTLLDEAGTVLAAATALEFRRLDRAPATAEAVADLFLRTDWEKSPREKAAREPGRPRTWLVLRDDGGLGADVAQRLRAAGDAVIEVEAGARFERRPDGSFQVDPGRPDDLARLLAEAASPGAAPLHGIVHLWALDAPSGEACAPAALAAAEARVCHSTLHLVQALAQAGLREVPRLWLVTRGATPAAGATVASPAQASLWGLGKVIALEHPASSCTRIDLGSSAASDAEALADELAAGAPEEEVALRSEGRFVARLAQGLPADGARPSRPRRSARAGSDPLRLEIARPGVLDELVLREAAQAAPGAGEVLVQVAAAGLNFSDVMKAMGVYPTAPGEAVQLGGECAGRVVAVGEGVQRFQPGDEVVGFAPFAFGSFARTPAAALVKKPPQLSFACAAGIPVAFATAWYALRRCARLQRGERLLVHSGAGGVGLAAIAIARSVGAEVLATAGTEEKRGFLRSLGVKTVMDSRSLAWADEVVAATEGRGVDVVLNALPGEAMARGLSVLAPRGRFLEIGKKDIYQGGRLGLSPFRNNLAFFAIDLDGAFKAEPGLGGELLEEIFAALASGALEPLPVRTFPLGEAAEAFRLMAQARHVGKLVIEVDGQEVAVEAAGDAARCRPDGTYLVTGGLSGLGLLTANWLVERGARHLVLLGRRAPSAEAETALARLRDAGIEVRVEQVDVASEAALGATLARVRREMPPLRGVVHSAAALADGTLLRLDASRFRAATVAKVEGAWLLHRLTREDPLELFVLYSSAASLLGSTGQGNYAAGNAFLDALAHHRRGLGHPALSVNWGPWREVGLAAVGGGGDTFRGFETLSPRQGLAALEAALHAGAVQVGVSPFSVRQWFDANPSSAESSLFARLAREQRAQGGAGAPAVGGAAAALRATLEAAAPGPARRELLETHVREQLARVVRKDLSRIGPATPVGQLGVDSLMALELRNRLEASLGLRLPATFVWAHPTPGAMANHLAGRMGIALEAAAPAAVEPAADEGQVTEALAELARLGLDGLTGLDAGAATEGGATDGAAPGGKDPGEA